MTLEVYIKIEEAILVDFPDIVLNTNIIFSSAGLPKKLRINFIDSSYLDIWVSKNKDYSYHWERRLIDGLIFRHDNAPHEKWNKIKTFPKHFHNGSDLKAIASEISDNPIIAVRQFILFIKKKLKQK